MIWNRLPKVIHVGIDTLEFGVYDAVCNFNEGKKSSIEILAEVQIQAGHYTTLGCIELNENRVSRSIYQQSPANATRRKVKRGLKKRKTDKHTEKEGLTYKAG